MNGLVIGVTLFSLVLAAAMTLMAWRAARREHPRLNEPAPVVEGDGPGRARASSRVFEPPRPEALGTVPAAVLLLVAALSGGGLAAFLMSQIDVGHAASVDESTDAAAPALELVSLEHTRLANRFVVRGIVANPDIDRAAGPIAAIVQFFDGEGRTLATVRAAVGALDPGSTAPFSVAVPDRGQQRYHVSFEVGGQSVIPVDRLGVGTTRSVQRN